DARNLSLLRGTTGLRRRGRGRPPPAVVSPLRGRVAVRQAPLPLLRGRGGRAPGATDARGGARGGLRRVRLPGVPRVCKGGGPAPPLERRPRARRGLGLAPLRSDRAPAGLLAPDSVDRPARRPVIAPPSHRECGKIPPSLMFPACIRA